MTIDEAIEHHEERAEELEKRAEEVAMLDAEGVYQLHVGICREYAEEHRQNAEWLKELKKYRAIFEKVGKILADNGYTIDDLDTIFGKVNREVNADGYSD